MVCLFFNELLGCKIETLGLQCESRVVAGCIIATVGISKFNYYLKAALNIHAYKTGLFSS